MKNEKIKKVLIFAGVMIVLILAIDFVIMPLIVSSEVISVPNITNKHKDEAIKILEAANLNPVLQPPGYDEKVKKDFVILQRPVAGSMVKTGRRVYIVISGGDEKVIVPNLYGKSAKDAQITLENAGLAIGFIEQTESEETQGTVILQQITPNATVNKGTKVSITLSMGPAEGMIRAPKLLGKSLKDAESFLATFGLKVGNVEYRFSPGLLPNTVLEQEPSEGTLIKKDGSMDLVVSSSKK
jgi:serine/threonine-protein kinase